jgi:hypothetical protein
MYIHGNRKGAISGLYAYGFYPALYADLPHVEALSTHHHANILDARIDRSTGTLQFKTRKYVTIIVTPLGPGAWGRPLGPSILSS